MYWFESENDSYSTEWKQVGEFFRMINNYNCDICYIDYLESKNKRKGEALNEYQKYNQIRNDLDAYLFEMGEWALGNDILKKRPDSKNYGI